MSKERVLGRAALIARMRRISANMPDIVSGEQVQNLMLRRTLDRFDSGVSPENTPWPPLEKSTIERKERGGYPYPKKPLHRTSLLRDSIAIIHGLTTGLLVSNTGLGFRIGVDNAEASEYGRLHNRGEGGQKLRKFLGVGYLDTESVRALVARNLKKAMRK